MLLHLSLQALSAQTDSGAAEFRSGKLILLSCILCIDSIVLRSEAFRSRLR